MSVRPFLKSCNYCYDFFLWWGTGLFNILLGPEVITKSKRNHLFPLCVYSTINIQLYTPEYIAKLSYKFTKIVQPENNFYSPALSLDLGAIRMKITAFIRWNCLKLSLQLSEALSSFKRYFVLA